MEHAMGLWSHHYGRLNPFKAQQGEVLSGGMVRNHYGRLIRVQGRVLEAVIDVDILTHEIQYRKQHMVIFSFLQGKPQASELAEWQRLFHDGSKLGTAFLH
jgi:hypothetical protein